MISFGGEKWPRRSTFYSLDLSVKTEFVWEFSPHGTQKRPAPQGIPDGMASTEKMCCERSLLDDPQSNFGHQISTLKHFLVPIVI